jgi:hypothetical protein
LSLASASRSGWGWRLVVLELGDVLDDSLDLLVDLILLAHLILLKLLNSLEHLLHPIGYVGLLLLELSLQLAKGVCKVFNVCPCTIGLCLFYFLENVLIVGEVLVVEFTVVPEKEGREIE